MSNPPIPQEINGWKRTGTCKCGHPIRERVCPDGGELESLEHHICPISNPKKITKAEIDKILTAPCPEGGDHDLAFGNIFRCFCMKCLTRFDNLLDTDE